MSEMEKALGGQESLPIKKYLGIFFRYKYLILFIFFVGSAIGVTGAFLLVPSQKVFDGYKQVVLRNPDTELGFITGNIQLGQERTFFLEAEINRLMDVEVLKTVVRTCSLNQQELAFHERYLKTPRGRIMEWMKDTFSFLLSNESHLPAEQRFFERAVNQLKDQLVISPVSDRRSRYNANQGAILSVQYTNEDKTKVKEVITTFVEENRKLRKQAYQGSELIKKQKELFTKELNDLEIKLDDIKQELEGRYDRLNLPFNSDPSFVMATATQRTIQKQNRQTELATNIERSKILITQYQEELDALPLLPAQENVPSNTPRARQLQQDIQTLEEQRTDINTRLVSRTLAQFQRKELEETLKNVNDRLKTLNKELQDLSETKEFSSPESARIQRAISHEKINLSFLEEEQKELKEALSKQVVEENALRSKIGELTALRDSYNQQVARVEAKKRMVDNFGIYEYARKDVEVLRDLSSQVIVSDKPRSAHKLTRMKVALGVLFATLAAGLGLAFALGMVLDSSFHNPKDIEQNLEVSVIACIPESKSRLLK